MKQILHAGCGCSRLPDWLVGEEIRLDIDKSCKPDILASMTDMGPIGPYDAVYCHHALEHCYPYEIQIALGEFLRVLRPGGYALVFVPDLEDVRPTNDILYESPAGPIAGLDLLYGHRASLEAHPWMAHHTGFIAATLENALTEAGFQPVRVHRLSGWELFGVGAKAA